MYKMIIIDDEYLVRTGLRSTIEWKDYAVEIVGEASNGVDGLELIKQSNPDLIITDIRMPAMNGVDLIKKLYQDNFKGEIIVLSGYRDFDYARETFEHGIFSYLLKPINNAELIKVVLNAIAKLEEKKRSGNQNFSIANAELIVKKILIDEQTLESEIVEKLEMYNISIPSSGLIVVVEAEKSEINENILRHFRIIFNELLQRNKIINTNYLLIPNLLFFIKEIKQEKLIDILQEAIKNFEKTSYDCLSIGLSQVYLHYHDIKNCYEKTLEVARKRFFIGINSINLVNDVETKYKRNLVFALEIISRRYHENLTVKMVAEELLVSESYLMHLFKDSLNQTFNDILTKHRIIIAKSLLLKGKYRIKEIASMVGYNDVKYFSYVFKKEIGVNPSQYIESKL